MGGMGLLYFFTPAYLKLRVWGFSGWQAKSILENRVPISTARSVGPQRLSGLEDVLAITEFARNCDKPNQDVASLEEIAKARPQFTAKELAELAATKQLDARHRVTAYISLADVKGYEAVGIATPADMCDAFGRGLIYGKEIPGLIELGITEREDMAFAQRSGLNPSAISGYMTEGKVNDLKVMARLHRVSVYGWKIPAYKELGAETEEAMIAMANAGVVGVGVESLPTKFKDLGVTIPGQRKDLLMADIFPEDVLRYKQAGVNEPRDMIYLRELGIISHSAVNLAESGLMGDVAGMAASAASAMQSQPRGTR